MHYNLYKTMKFIASHRRDGFTFREINQLLNLADGTSCSSYRLAKKFGWLLRCEPIR